MKRCGEAVAAAMVVNAPGSEVFPRTADRDGEPRLGGQPPVLDLSHAAFLSLK